MTTTLDLNKLMARIQSLLGLADQPGIMEEAAAIYRQRAETLMREYRSLEENLIASDQVEIAPEVHRLWLGPTTDATRGASGGRGGSRGGESYYQKWYNLAYASALHAGAKVHYAFGRNAETGQYGLFAVIVGYSGDLRLAELIYSNARLVFGDRVEPKADPALSDAVNAYRLRSAGITRDRAAKLIWGETSHARAAAVGRMYKEECERRGEKPVLDGRGINAAHYRDQYAEGFVQEFSRRLRAARDAADSVGGKMVLAGREERIQEAFWTEFPALRPQPKTEVAETETAPAKKERKRKNYWDTVAGRRDLERYGSGVASAARSAGTRAAGEVSLDRASNAQRVDGAAPTAREALEG